MLAWLSAIGLGVYLILSPASSSSLSNSIQTAEDERNDLLLQMETDKNQSEQKELELSRLSREYSSRIDDAEFEEKKIDDELAGITPKGDQLDEEIASQIEELDSLKEKLAEARAPLEKIELESKPLLAKGDELKSSIAQLEAELLAQKQKSDAEAAKLAVFETKRRVASESFISEKQRLSEGVKKPFHLHYADKIEITVRNKVPSGKGFFADAGYDKGLREGMEFMGEKTNDPNSLPFRMELGLVEDSYSYLKFIYPDEPQYVPPSLEQDDVISLTRSGSADFSESFPESNSTK